MSRHLRLLTTAFLAVALVSGAALAGPGGPVTGGVDGDPDGPMRMVTSDMERTAPAERQSMVVSDEGARADVQVKEDWWLSVLKAYLRLSGILAR